jgi:hypothetical protein
LAAIAATRAGALPAPLEGLFPPAIAAGWDLPRVGSGLCAIVGLLGGTAALRAR